MKTNLRYCLAYLIAGIFVSTSSFVQAQSVQPNSWSSFVQSEKNNPLVIDTFLLQTFQGKSTDNWNYTVEKGSVSIEDITNLDANVGAHGDKALKIRSNTEVKFEHYDVTPFDSVYVYMHEYAILNNDSVRIRLFRNHSEALITLLRSSTSAFKGTPAPRNPLGLDIITPTLKSESIVLFDSVMTLGFNRQYSLFTGTGDWGTSEHWSHLPARRSNTALIQGNTSLTDERTTKVVHISGGSLQIASTGKLHTNELTLYDADNSHASLITSGQLEINNQLIVEKTFPAKGKWYFFSLPFDVYTNDIENFTFKDDTETGSGNYFYLQTYNGQKRANGQPGWSVVSASQTTDQPIIHKHQGYLIALDAAATTTTVRFHCPNTQIPETLGKAASIEITPNTGGNEANNGWILCGNPLPAPLALRNIEGAEGLDGYIYLYQNEAYQAYSLDSDYALAPYSAFFIKATEETVLEITPSTEVVSSARLLACEAPLRASQEPQSNPTSNQIIPAINEVRIQQEPHQIRIEYLPEAGVVHWLNAKGQVISTEVVPAGNSCLRYPSTAGFYLLHLRYGQHEQVVKCVK